MKRRLSVLEQGRAWERAFLKQRRHLRERQRVGQRIRFRESAAALPRHRMAALARKRPDLLATITFHEAYHGTRVRGRTRPGSDALAAFKESYQRP